MPIPSFQNQEGKLVNGRWCVQQNYDTLSWTTTIQLEVLMELVLDGKSFYEALVSQLPKILENIKEASYGTKNP